MDQPEVDQPTTFDARIQSFSLQPKYRRRMSAAALAARSLRLANQITDPVRHAEAIRNHFELIEPLMPVSTLSCPGR